MGSIDQKENKLAERHVIGVVKRKESVTSQESETMYRSLQCCGETDTGVGERGGHGGHCRIFAFT